ncbi:MAG: peptidase C25 [Pirellulaceae bacterium]|nr:peptidase C25 [Pirellulaceae bacterium]
MNPRTIGTLLLLCAATLGSSVPVSAADVIAVCPEKFRESLQPWLLHRRSEGIEVAVVDSTPDAQSLSEAIGGQSNDQTKYVVLVGDAPVIGNRGDKTRQVPSHYLKTTVTSNWGSTPTLASDLPFGDFNGDQVPDAVVGRLPVQRAGELDQLIQRIIAYEQSDDFGLWRSQVQLIGGIGGFGAMADAAIESVTRTVVTSVLPTETKTSVAYASPGHLFYPKGESFTDAIVDQYAQGSRFWVYAGHGRVTALDRVPQTRDGVPVLDHQSISRLSRPAKSAPIALMLACYTGAIDAADDSLGERMMLFDGGPIAVFAGSRVTMPYGNTTAAVGLIKGVYEEKLPRLGDAWLSALKQMHADDPNDKSTSRMMIDALATMVSPAGTKLVDERHEHMGLYNLFGDPLLRLHPPENAELNVATGFAPGQPIVVDVHSPIDGELTVSIDRPLGAITSGDPNATTVAQLVLPIKAGGKASPQFLLPDDVVGPLLVRANIAGETTWATGSAKTRVRQPRK